MTDESAALLDKYYQQAIEDSEKYTAELIRRADEMENTPVWEALEDSTVYAVCQWVTERQSLLDDIASKVDRLLGERRTGTFTLQFSRPGDYVEPVVVKP